MNNKENQTQKSVGLGNFLYRGFKYIFGRSQNQNEEEEKSQSNLFSISNKETSQSFREEEGKNHDEEKKEEEILPLANKNSVQQNNPFYSRKKRLFSEMNDCTEEELMKKEIEDLKRSNKRLKTENDYLKLTNLNIGKVTFAENEESKSKNESIIRFDRSSFTDFSIVTNSLTNINNINVESEINPALQGNSNDTNKEEKLSQIKTGNESQLLEEEEAKLLISNFSKEIPEDENEESGDLEVTKIRNSPSFLIDEQAQSSSSNNAQLQSNSELVSEENSSNSSDSSNSNPPQENNSSDESQEESKEEEENAENDSNLNVSKSEGNESTSIRKEDGAAIKNDPLLNSRPSNNISSETQILNRPSNVNSHLNNRRNAIIDLNQGNRSFDNRNSNNIIPHLPVNLDYSVNNINSNPNSGLLFSDGNMNPFGSSFHIGRNFGYFTTIPPRTEYDVTINGQVLRGQNQTSDPARILFYNNTFRVFENNQNQNRNSSQLSSNSNQELTNNNRNMNSRVTANHNIRPLSNNNQNPSGVLPASNPFSSNINGSRNGQNQLPSGHINMNPFLPQQRNAPIQNNQYRLNNNYSNGSSFSNNSNPFLPNPFVYGNQGAPFPSVRQPIGQWNPNLSNNQGNVNNFPGQFQAQNNNYNQNPSNMNVHRQPNQNNQNNNQSGSSNNIPGNSFSSNPFLHDRRK